MPECERCGKKARLTLVLIEGAEMYLCPDCSKYGKVIEKKPEPKPVQRPRPAQTFNRPKKPDALSKREKELAEDYPGRIRKARERLGLSREDLGRKINERVSVITKLEHGQMHPSDALIKKLEKALSIQLLEEVEDYTYTPKAESSGMTLADFIVTKKK
jgi:putative transcription factor